MADFERLIPVDGEDGDGRPVSRTSSFSRMSLARFSQRLRRRGGAVAADDEHDKENAHVVGKRVKFDKRVYHGPVAPPSDRSGGAPYAAVRGILKTSTGRAERRGTAPGTVGYSNRGYDDTVPNRMRMYDVPVTSFYIGASDHLQLPPAVKRSSSAAAAAPRPEPCKKTRRFGTEIGSYTGSRRGE